jgi:hypothetical protein
VLAGDAMVYRNAANDGGHIFLYDTGDPWGSMWAYECKGCSSGCLHGIRSAGSAYVAIRRHSISEPVAKSTWSALPGLAYDIGSGAGQQWVIGANPVPGGYGIFYWSGANWTPVDGGAVRIAVDSSGVPWVVNSAGNIFRRQNGGWAVLPGAAYDVAAGGGQTWVIGMNPVPGGYGIFYWTGSGWYPVEGGAVRVAVDPSGVPWVVNSAGNIFRRQNNAWTVMPGLARDIGIGANGAVWVIGTNSVPGGGSPFYWTGSSWAVVDGGGVGITVDFWGRPWMVNSAGNIFYRP